MIIDIAPVSMPTGLWNYLSNCIIAITIIDPVQRSSYCITVAGNISSMAFAQFV